MLQVRRLEKIIEGQRAIFIDALDIQAGEVVAVVGPVRSGKTLLLRLLAGMIPLSGGSIAFDGECISRIGNIHRQTGILFEEDLLYERQSALNNLKFYSQILYGSPTMSAADALVQVGLSDEARKPVSKLPPSSRRRLAFARVLMGPRRLLLLDQPIRRADLDTQELFAHLIRQMAAEGAAILLSDEDVSWASRCCTRVVELEDGHIASAYTLESANTSLAAAPERFTPFKVPARKEDRILLYDPSDILYATSREGKTYLRTDSEEVVTNFTLQELESLLAGRGFFKAHRAYLVNLQRIKAIIQYTRASYTLQLDDKPQTMIPLSKQSEKELQELMGY